MHGDWHCGEHGGLVMGMGMSGAWEWSLRWGIHGVGVWLAMGTGYWDAHGVEMEDVHGGGYEG